VAPRAVLHRGLNEFMLADVHEPGGGAKTPPVLQQFVGRGDTDWGGDDERDLMMPVVIFFPLLRKRLMRA
jgi:hypothetical protein